MKLRFRFASLRPDSDARLPAALALLLLLVLAGQTMLTNDVELPPIGAVAQRAPHRTAAPPPRVIVPPILLDRAIFSPSAGGSGGSGAPTATDPLGGIIVAGSVRIGRSSYALVQVPGDKPRNIGVGDTIAGWKMTGLTNEAATFVRGGQRIRLAFGARAAGATPPAEGEDQ